MNIGESREWVWSAPDLRTGRCPSGFGESSWGCFRRKTLGEGVLAGRNGVWLGVAGLVLSAGIMIAMGFHKPVRRHSRATRR